MAGFHSRAVPAASAVARVLPSGLNATEYTAIAPTVSDAPPTCSLVATFHSRAVPSAPPVARVVPSGLNATEYTAPVREALKPRIRRPAGTRHRPTVPSVPAVARI